MSELFVHEPINGSSVSILKTFLFPNQNPVGPTKHDAIGSIETQRNENEDRVFRQMCVLYGNDW